MRLDVFGGIAANQSTLHGHAQNSQINDVQTIISPVPENHLGLETIEPKSPAETSWGASSISPQLVRNCSATSTQRLQDFPVSSVAFSLRTTTATLSLWCRFGLGRLCLAFHLGGTTGTGCIAVHWFRCVLQELRFDHLGDATAVSCI